MGEHSGHGGGMGDIFDMFGGGRQQQQRTRKVKPTVHRLKCTLADIFNGKKTKIKVNRTRLCGGCDGKGGKDVQKCTDCEGQGMKTTLQMVGPGMYTQRTGPCDECEGQGEIISESGRCKECKGKKVKKDVKIFDVEVDKGAPHGEKYTIFGEGDQIPDAEAGDVIIVVDIQPHETFKRKGADILMEKHISLIDALTGVDFTVTHLDGKKFRVQSEPGDVIKPNSLMTLRELGLPFFKTPYKNGHLFILFKVDFPDRIKKDTFKALEKVLPNKSNNKETKDVSETVVLEEFHENQKNTSAKGGQDAHDSDEEDEEGGQRGPGGVQCAQQ